MINTTSTANPMISKMGIRLLAMALAATNAMAQPALEGTDKNGPDDPKAALFNNDFSNMIEPLLKSHSRIARDAFKLQIDHLQELCELPEAVAKGLRNDAEKFADKWIKAHRKYATQMGQMQFPPNNAELEEPPNHDPFELVNDKEWQKLLMQKLTPDQRSKYVAERKRREQVSVELLLDTLINALDARLLFSPDQAKKLQPVIRERLVGLFHATLGKDSHTTAQYIFSQEMGFAGMPGEVLAMEPGMIGGWVGPGPGDAGTAEQKDSEEANKLAFETSDGKKAELNFKDLHADFEKVLSKTQFRVWKDDVWPQAVEQLTFFLNPPR